MHGHLHEALAAPQWRDRADHLSKAWDLLVEQQVGAGLPGVDVVCVPFFERPYLGLDPTLVSRILGEVRDPEVRAWPTGLGSIEQRSDNVDLLTDVTRRRAAVGL